MIYRSTLFSGALFALLLTTTVPAVADEVETVVVEATEPQAAMEDTAEAVPDVDPVSAEALEVTDEDLVMLVGYLSAQGAGIGMLDLDAEQTDALLESFTAALLGKKSIEDVDQSVIETAMSEARARLEASGSGEEAELPSMGVETPGILGLIIVAQTGLLDFEFDADEIELIKEGFLKGLSDGEMSEEVMAMMPAFQTYMQGKVAAVQARMAKANAGKAESNRASGESFLSALRESDPEVQVTDSGLHFKVLEPGGEELPKLSDSVLVHYRGTLTDGTQFDSSFDRGQPATFPLKGVVPGFGEGLTKIGEGGKIMLYIPSNLGYGDNPRPGGVIKPGDTLVFECELLQINP